jgi:two-component system chemotaxis response regulator CheY
VQHTGIILCVDDESGILDTLSQQLEDSFGETHRIETANSGEDAWELIQFLYNEGETVELIITDQVMPGLKGDKFLEKVNQILPDTIKILLTGHAGLSSAIHAINYGGLDRYIEKPWDKDSLTDDIKKLISKFRQNIENQHLLNRLEKRVQELETQDKSEN